MTSNINSFSSKPVNNTTSSLPLSEPLRASLSTISSLADTSVVAGDLRENQHQINSFVFSEEEKTLINQIVNHLNLPPTLCLFDILMFDLLQSVASFKNLAGEQSIIEIANQLAELWVIQKNQDTRNISAFVKSIKNVNTFIFASLQKKHQELASSSTLTKEEKNANCAHIIKTLNPRINFLIKLLSDNVGLKMSFEIPFSKISGCNHMQEAYTKKTLLPLASAHNFLKVFLEIALPMNQELNNANHEPPHENSEFADNIISLFNQIANSHPDNIKVQINQLLDPIKQPPIPSYVADTVRAIFSGCLDHMEQVDRSQEELVQKMTHLSITDPSSSIRLTAPPKKNTDKLWFLKQLRLVPDTFMLTDQENELLNHLFKIYPLSSKFSLLDLLSFATYESFEDLIVKFPLISKKIAFYQKCIAADCYVLYPVIKRSNKEWIAEIGAPTNNMKETILARWNNALMDIKASIEASQNKRPKKVKDRSLQQMKPITTIYDLMKKLLENPFCEDLLLRNLSESYVGSEVLDSDDPKSREMLTKYWNFQMSTRDAANSPDYPNLPIGFLNELTPFFKGNDLQSPEKSVAFRSRFADAIKSMNTLFGIFGVKLSASLEKKITCNSELQEIVKSAQISTKNNKSMLEVDTFCWNLLRNNLSFLVKMLELAEFRLLSSTSTQKSLVRLIDHFHHLSRYHLGPSSLTSPLGTELESRIRNVLSPTYQSLLEHFTEQPLGKFTDFIRKVSENQELQFATCFTYLFQHKELILDINQKTMNSLSLASEQIKIEVKECLNRLSLEELKKITVDEINTITFQASLPMFRMVLGLIDMLTVLQIREFKENAEMIPSQMADLLELDGLEELLDELIKSKTDLDFKAKSASEPAVEENSKEAELINSSPSMKIDLSFKTESSSKPALEEILQEEEQLNSRNSKKINRSANKNHKTKANQKVEKSKPALKNQGAQKTAIASSKSTSNEVESIEMLHAEEIRRLRKSRRLVQKLQEIGFTTVEFTGSHRKMRNKEGQTLTVPNHPEIKYGTRSAIADQYLGLERLRNNNNNNNNDGYDIKNNNNKKDHRKR